MADGAADGKNFENLREVAMDLKVMLDDISSDFHRNREEYLSDAARVSASTASSMKKTVLRMPLIQGTSVNEAAGRYEVLRDLEYIRLSLEEIMLSTQDKVNRQVLFSGWAVEELDVLFRGADSILLGLAGYLGQCCDIDSTLLEEEAERLTGSCLHYTRQHKERFKRGICTPESSVIYQSMLDSFRDIFRHAKSCLIKVYTQ